MFVYVVVQCPTMVCVRHAFVVNDLDVVYGPQLSPRESPNSLSVWPNCLYGGHYVQMVDVTGTRELAWLEPLLPRGSCLINGKL